MVRCHVPGIRATCAWSRQDRQTWPPGTRFAVLAAELPRCPSRLKFNAIYQIMQRGETPRDIYSNPLRGERGPRLPVEPHSGANDCGILVETPPPQHLSNLWPISSQCNLVLWRQSAFFLLLKLYSGEVSGDNPAPEYF